MTPLRRIHPETWRRAALLTLLALAAALPLCAQDAPKAKKTPKPSALFATDSLLTFTLVTDFQGLAGQRDTMKHKAFPGVVRIAGAQGERSIPVEVYTRGHYRLRSDRCSFPPLRLVFGKGTKDTPFDDQKALKLITHCRDNSDDYQDYVLREFLAYRAHALVTPASFRARLARVRYVRSRDTTKVLERYGFLLESERELARRMGGRLLEAKNARYGDIAPDSAVTLSMWQYFLGNTDWSLSALHNVRLVQREQDVFAVPYDFDFSGFVGASYAIPDPMLPIKSVTERLWRGPCPTREAIAAATAPFLAQRAAIEAVPRSLPGVENGWAERAQRYIRQFYDDVRDPGRFASFARSVRPGCPLSN
ncbi:hypothetical protein [Roseisolibacter agri]|uniref:Uncharacterized protein n=1 Tax=Roseisolibacter agri TaxID=2014610 RepID=A0AA37VFE1_9BACT|nr:hypothetical protein [Roseisolibacter agri]GLC26729.1 hypothetical protein rosag_32420 [Roseisolibacter agri]